MTESYFQRVRAETPTRLWINNPTAEEIELAIAQGAAGSTTNPAYGGNLLRREGAFARATIDAALAEAPGADDAAVADLVQERLVRRIVDAFGPLHERSGGTEGFVSIQGSPLTDHDAARILHEARAGRAIGPNATPKIPATLPGLAAFEELVAEGSPTIVTEVFSLSQLIETNERYLQVTERTGVRPPFFMSPITGILGDHLRKVAAHDGIVATPRALELAGVALARRCNDVVEARSYPVTLLFGGARIVDDFTALVGGRTASTINYSTVDEIVALDPPVGDTIHEETPGEIVEELLLRFEDFRRGWTIEGLAPDEFEHFGPVQHFRDAFVSGWRSVLAAVADHRSAVGVA